MEVAEFNIPPSPNYKNIILSVQSPHKNNLNALEEPEQSPMTLS
jgi:hypothetical protein